MIIQRLGVAIALALFILGLAAGLAFASGAGLVSDELARRAMQVAIGLIAAAYANYMPKRRAACMTGSPQAETWSQAALRVGGWSLTIAGLVYAALWAFAPLAFADIASIVVVSSALAITLGYALRAHLICRRSVGTGADR